MLIDCNQCAMQHTSQCDDCVVTFLLAEGGGTIELAGGEEEALANLVKVGLVPPLRMVPRDPGEQVAQG